MVGRVVEDWESGALVISSELKDSNVATPIEFSPSSATWINALPVVASYLDFQYGH